MLRNLRPALIVGGIVAVVVLAVATTPQTSWAQAYGGAGPYQTVAIGGWNSNADTTSNYLAEFKVVNPSDGGALSAGAGSPTYVCANVYFFSDVPVTSTSNFPLAGCGACNLYEFGSLEFKETSAGETASNVNPDGHVYIVTTMPGTGGEAGCDATNGNQYVLSPGVRAWTIEDKPRNTASVADPMGLSTHEFEQVPLSPTFYKALAAQCKTLGAGTNFECFDDPPKSP